jgi:mRNA-degrading endonuclease toxin of MazEF toxin-antitoxin module
MTIYKFGDVILVPFPFTDQTTSKKRPAVAISSDAYNQIHIFPMFPFIFAKIQKSVKKLHVNKWYNLH